MVVIHFFILATIVTAAVSSIIRLGNLTLGPPYCTDSTAWTEPAFERLDCRAALDAFLEVTVEEYGDVEFEFLRPGAYPSTSSQFTQRRSFVTQDLEAALQGVGQQN